MHCIIRFHGEDRKLEITYNNEVPQKGDFMTIRDDLYRVVARVWGPAAAYLVLWVTPADPEQFHAG